MLRQTHRQVAFLTRATFVTLFVTFFFGAARTASAVSEVIYDSLPGRTTGGDGIGLGLELAQAMDMAGTGRTVSKIELWLGADSAYQYLVRFYQMDGAGGSPGTEIWESPVQVYPFTAGSYNRKIVPVSVPSVVVPDVFAWSVAPVSADGNPIVGETVGPPAVGTYLGKWVKTSSWAPGVTTIHGYGSRITTIPEPASGCLAACLFGTLALRVRRARRG